MFLWCGCHCPEESQSVPPNPGSESVSFLSESIVSESIVGSIQPPPQPPRVGCDVCTFGVAPAVYEFEWNYTGKAIKAFPPRPCCSAYTGQQKYRLYSRQTNFPLPPFGNLSCSWSSNEQVKWRKMLPPFGATATCVDNGVGRVALTIQRDQINRVFATAVVNYHDSTSINAGTPGILAQAIYLLVDANGNRIFNATGSMGCLQPLRFRATWALEGRPPVWFRSTTIQGVPYGSPCDQDSFSMIDSGLPEYVTCTPAAA
jgi:hypothetical protein